MRPLNQSGRLWRLRWRFAQRRNAWRLAVGVLAYRLGGQLEYWAARLENLGDRLVFRHRPRQFLAAGPGAMPPEGLGPRILRRQHSPLVPIEATGPGEAVMHILGGHIVPERSNNDREDDGA